MLSKNIHRQQLAAQCNSNYPTERYNITYLYLDTGMISWLKQDFSTEHTTSTETGAWNSLASFPLQWSISFSAFHPVVCRYWWSLCTISKACEWKWRRQVYSQGDKLLVKGMQIRKKVKVTGIIWPFSVLLWHLKQLLVLYHLRINKKLSVNKKWVWDKHFRKKNQF